jgi:hypothetical protein
METKLKALCEKITKETQEYLIKRGLGCQCNLDQAIYHYYISKKYTRIDNKNSGRYMVENSTGNIYGIKAYGVINKGHYYGTLETIDNYFWGDYKAVKL